MRLLRGIFSQIAWRLSQVNLMGIPGHALAIMGLLGVAAAMTLPLTHSLAHREPVSVSITALATGESDATHVTVTGFPIYGNPMVLETTDGSSGNVTNQEFYWALIDRKGPGRIFVHSDDDPSGRLAEVITLTGRLRQPASEVRDGLAGVNTPVQPTLATHVLEPGEGVIPAGISSGIMILCLLGGLLLLLGGKDHFTVFTPRALSGNARTVSPPSAETPIVCQVTGKIALKMPGGNVRHVKGRDITCQIVPGQTEEGHPLGHFLLSRVTAGGVVMESEMALPPGTPAEAGIVTRGLSSRPSLRIQGEEFAGHLLFESADEAIAAREAIARP